MELDIKILTKLANGFLLIGIIGTIEFLIREILIILDLLDVISFLYTNTITSIFGVVIGIILYYLLDKGFEDIGIETEVKMKYFKNAKKFIIFYPISLGINSALNFINPFLSSPNIIILYAALGYGIVLCVFLILGFIAGIYLGIYLYKIGKSVDQAIISIGGLILIFLPWVGGIILFIGFKRLITELSI